MCDQQTRLEQLLDVFPGGFAVHQEVLLKIPETEPAAAGAFEEAAQFLRVQLAVAPLGQKPREAFQALVKQILPDGARPGGVRQGDLAAVSPPARPALASRGYMISNQLSRPWAIRWKEAREMCPANCEARVVPKQALSFCPPGTRLPGDPGVFQHDLEEQTGRQGAVERIQFRPGSIGQPGEPVPGVVGRQSGAPLLGGYRLGAERILEQHNRVIS